MEPLPASCLWDPIDEQKLEAAMHLARHRPDDELQEDEPAVVESLSRTERRVSFATRYGMIVAVRYGVPGPAILEVVCRPQVFVERLQYGGPPGSLEFVVIGAMVISGLAALVIAAVF